MSTYIVLLGPPGAGKGTQAQYVSNKLDIVHVSSGDIFRENLNNKTKLGVLAKGYMDKGELVPDDVTIEMIKERIQRPDCTNGVLLDGFPRTPKQAESLELILKDMSEQIKIVPYIAVPAEELIKRLAGRWTCPVCGRVYHELYNPSKQSGICDDDGAKLYQRDDDKPETVERRIRVYIDQTEPLIEYYRQKNILVEVDGTKSIDLVSSDLLHEINKRK